MWSWNSSLHRANGDIRSQMIMVPYFLAMWVTVRPFQTLDPYVWNSKTHGEDKQYYFKKHKIMSLQSFTLINIDFSDMLFSDMQKKKKSFPHVVFILGNRKGDALLLTWDKCNFEILISKGKANEFERTDTTLSLWILWSLAICFNPMWLGRGSSHWCHLGGNQLALLTFIPPSVRRQMMERNCKDF